MSIKSRIRRWLPATSRNVDARFEDLDQRLHQVLAQQQEVLAQQQELSVQIHNQNRNLSIKSAEIMQSLSTLEDLRFWHLFKKDNETLMDAKRRFFLSLPQATGMLRRLQQASVILLERLDEICRTHGLRYWLAYGTLIGAVRHKKHIPWDDDLDIQMPRADYERLCTIIENEPDLRIAHVYDRYALCDQIRLRTADPKNPSFLDIFIMDFLQLSRDEACQVYEKHRSALETELIALDTSNEYFWSSTPYLSEEGEGAALVAAVFNKHVGPYREAAIKQIVPENSFNPGAPNTQVIRGIDNMRPIIFDFDGFPGTLYFPLASMNFDKLDCLVPRESEELLSRIFKDIWSLPLDIVTHWKHVDLDKVSYEFNEQLFKSEKQ
jgi:lipopolysaccharide cholinephosphotransferase